MKDTHPLENDCPCQGSKSARDARIFSHKVLRYSSYGMQRIEFLQNVCRMLIDASGSEAVELCVREGEGRQYWHAALEREGPFHCETVGLLGGAAGTGSTPSETMPHGSELCLAVIEGRLVPEELIFTVDGDYPSAVLVPLAAAGAGMGVMCLKSLRPGYFSEKDVEFCEDVGQTLSVAMVNRSAQAALRERVKELTCLYGIVRLVEKPGISHQELLSGTVHLLPPAWQYPEITVAGIELDGRSYHTPGFTESGDRQSADIVVERKKRGLVEVVYTMKRPTRDEGPFLKEERHLIDAVAKEVAHIVERDEAEREASELQEQLRHSDRLATIGQLAAGVAHELNEPLGSILGFAQLAMRNPDLPPEAKEDIKKIEAASLHARGIIRKLMLFARQKLPDRSTVDLNEVVEGGMYFLSSRCRDQGIEIVRSPAKDLPKITADPVQLNQALINLAVNAIHSMPGGGTLTIATHAAGDFVSLAVEDTGVGMTKETSEKIFLPFFTTKDVKEGTGLGLSVVHGIVTSHGGSITVESEVGVGSRFEIKLPVKAQPSPEETA